MSAAVGKLIEQITQTGAIKGVDLANFTDVSKATVSRWRAGNSTPNTDIQLILSDLRYVVDALAEFYTPEEIRLWLYANNQLLGGEKAIDLIHQQQADKVLDAIARLESHSFL